MPESPSPPQKPVRPSRNFSSSIVANTLKVNPTTSVNLENVNSPNLNKDDTRRSNAHKPGETPLLSPSPSATSFASHPVDGDPGFNAFALGAHGRNRHDDDNESQYSLYSKYGSTTNVHGTSHGSGNAAQNAPILTINNNEEDQLSIMETELVELLNGSSLTSDIQVKKAMEDYQINISDLLAKVSNCDFELDSISDPHANIINMASSAQDSHLQKGNQASQEEEDSLNFRNHKKQFFILSSSGKPIYSFFGSDNLVVNYMSIIQTLISSFQGLNPVLPDSKYDNLKYFEAGTTKFVILNKDPVYLLTISSFSLESVVDLRNQLYILYNYLLSIISKKQLVKFFTLKENFDLRKVLNNSDYLNLQKILVSKVLNPAFFLNGIESLYLSSSTKLKINSIMTKHRPNEMLYGILTDLNGKVITVLRPKNHFLHTIDVQVLFSIIFNKPISSDKQQVPKRKIIVNRKADNDEDVEFSNEEELWFPICLPEFNANGFLYCFVNYVDINNIEVVLHSESKNAEADLSALELEDHSNESNEQQSVTDNEGTTRSRARSSSREQTDDYETASKTANSSRPPSDSTDKNKLVFILLSPDKNSFFELRSYSKKVASNLILNSNSQILDKLTKAFKLNYRLNYLNFLSEFHKRNPSSSITSTFLPSQKQPFSSSHPGPQSKSRLGAVYQHNNFFHFIFKSRKNSQVFVPSFNSINVSSILDISFQKLMFLYKDLYNNLQHLSAGSYAHVSSPGNLAFGGTDASSADGTAAEPGHHFDNDDGGYTGKSNLVYIKWNIEANNATFSTVTKLIGIAYSNSNYEIYIVLKDPGWLNLSKNQLVRNLKVIINWIFKNFNRLFIAGMTF